MSLTMRERLLVLQSEYRTNREKAKLAGLRYAADKLPANLASAEAKAAVYNRVMHDIETLLES